MTTLYERIGAQAAVDKAVEIFYRKVLADDRINEFFDGVDMGRANQQAKGFSDHGFWWAESLYR